MTRLWAGELTVAVRRPTAGGSQTERTVEWNDNMISPSDSSTEHIESVKMVLTVLFPVQISPVRSPDNKMNVVDVDDPDEPESLSFDACSPANRIAEAMIAQIAQEDDSCCALQALVGENLRKTWGSLPTDTLVESVFCVSRRIASFGGEQLPTIWAASVDRRGNT